MNAVLASYSDSESYEKLKRIQDDYELDKICVDVALKNGFGSLIRMDSDFTTNWCPPFFTRKSPTEQDGFKFDAIVEHLVPETNLAQSVQAFVGLYFREAGPKVAIEIMKILKFSGIQKAEPKKFKTYQWKNSSIPTKSFKLNIPKDSNKFLNVDELQNVFGYRFKNRDLLLNSVCDTSLDSSKIKTLSLIGKCALDLILTHCAFQVDSDLALSNDFFLISSHAYAQIALEIELDKYLAFNSIKVFKTLNYFLREFHQSDQRIETKFLFQEDEIDDKSLVEIPDILVNAFQAIFGSIYIDSEFNLQTVFKVFSPFLSQKIGKYFSLRYFSYIFYIFFCFFRYFQE